MLQRLGVGGGAQHHHPVEIGALDRQADRARAGTSSGSNTLQIDSVVINTKATDGKQVAIDFMDEMKKRKDFVWQTESGLIP